MEHSQSEFPITPDTKIGALLERYPQLERTLIEAFPEFKRLRNPVLRKTIVKVTSLRQAAVVAKVPLAELINKLRDGAGIKEKFAADESIVPFPEAAPAWFSPSKIVRSLDARAMLDRGEQPIIKVLVDCKNLKAGEIFELIMPFLPVPLIERAQKQGYLVWVKEEGERLFKTYLTPNIGLF